MQLQATCQVGHEEYLGKYDGRKEEQLSFTKWATKHGKFKAPKYSKNPRYVNEKHIPECALDNKGCIVGTGSFYKRPYGHYTWEELYAPQEKYMRIRTADLLITDQIRREITGDDSGDDSDWLDRTGHPGFWIPLPPKKMEPNKHSFTMLKNGKHIKLPRAFASNPEKRTKIQRISLEEQFGKNASKAE